MKKNLISIIVPVYNSSDTIRRCIDSIINQTYKNIEIILINDGSTDDSEKIIKEYDDIRIKYHLITNHGVSYARNYGIKNATGDYICFVDSDDYIEPNMIEELINYASTYNVDIIRFSGYIENSKGKFDPIEFPLEDLTIYNNDKAKILDLIMREEKAIRCYTPLLFIKNKNINKFEEKLKYLEDKLFYIENLVDDKKILFLNKKYYYYTNNFNSKTKNFGNYYYNLLDLIDSFNYISERVKVYGYANSRVSVAYLILLLYRIEFFVYYNKYQQTRMLIKKLYSNKEFCNFLKERANNVTLFHKIEIFLLRIKFIYIFYSIVKLKQIIKELIK